MGVWANLRMGAPKLIQTSILFLNTTLKAEKKISNSIITKKFMKLIKNDTNYDV